MKCTLFLFTTLVLFGRMAICQKSETLPSSSPNTSQNSVQGGDSAPDLRTEAASIVHTLKERGWHGELSLVNDWSAILSENSSTYRMMNRYSLDVSVGVDGEKALNWHGSSAFVRLKHHLGDQGGDEDYVADAQGFSNIDAPPRTYLYELWFQQELMGKKVRIKGGKIDANSEFAVVHSAADFLNSSMGYSPTILALPTYPEPQPGISVFVHPKSPYEVSVGLFRTGYAGPMTLVEGGRTWSITDRELGGRASFGFWHLGGPLEDFDGDYDPGTHGLYSVLEQSIWKRPRAQSSLERQISAFLQFGQANGEVSAFTQHLGVGLVLDSPFAIRAHDSLGVAATTVRFTGDSHAAFEEHRETAIEIYYKLSVRQFLSLLPDVQYIHHPGGSRSRHETLVITPRLVISF